MSRLRIGVVGAGHLGRIHCRLLRTLASVELVGVADPVPGSRAIVEDEFHVPTHADLRELLGQIDAAIVATPTETHHAVTSELLRNGIHVFVEKPITPTAHLADELIAAADARQVVLQVGHVERFNPALRAARPHIGRPKYIEAVRTSGYTFRSTDIGVVLDLMVHDLDLVLSLVEAPVVQVEALGTPILGPHEDVAHARLVFADGCVANLSASRTSFRAQRGLQVFSDRGYASIDLAAGEATVVHPSPRVRAGEFDVATLSAEEKADLQQHLFRDLLPRETLAIEKRNAIQDEQQEFVACILRSRQPEVDGRQARAAVALAERILAKIPSAPGWFAPLGPDADSAAWVQPAILPGPFLGPRTLPSTPRRRAG